MLNSLGKEGKLITTVFYLKKRYLSGFAGIVNIDKLMHLKVLILLFLSSLMQHLHSFRLFEGEFIS